MLLDYFGKEPYREVKKQIVVKGEVVEIASLEANDFPTLAGFSRKIGVHRSTLHDWTKRYPEFQRAHLMAKDAQEHFLITNGLKGLIPPAFGIFTAKNVLGWRDKQPGEEDKTIINNFSSKADEELAQRIKELSGEK